MHEDNKQFSHYKPVEPSAGLFDRIILAIKKEQELRQTKRLLFGFLLLLIISFIATPVAFSMLASQIKSSGIFYFVSAAASDFGTFLTLWREFGLAILESLPIIEIAVFAISFGICIFTFRLFMHKKRLLLNYLMNKYIYE